VNIGFLYGRQTYPPGLGGSIHGYQLARGLVNRGHRLFSCFFDSDTNPLIHHFRGRQALKFLRTVDVLYVRLRWDRRSPFVPLRRLALKHLPVVCELNGVPEEILYTSGESGNLERITRRLRRLAKAVHAGIGVTRQIQEYLSRELAIPRTHCIPNGSDPGLFAPADRPADPHVPLRIAWVGVSKYGYHNLPALIETARLLARRQANVEFVLYGPRTNLADDLPANVSAVGAVPYEQLGARLAMADVGVHLFKPLPNGQLIDGSPLKVFDYMACGLAVIAQDNGQTGDLLRQTKAGLFTSGEPEDLAAQILALEHDRQRCRQLGRNGRQAVVEYYNWARVAAETEAVLQETLGR